MQVCGQQFTAEILARIEATMIDEPGLSRRALSARVCQWLNWRDGRGRLKAMSARVALCKLEDRGMVRLPAAQGQVPAARPVEGDLGEAGVLEMDLKALGPVEVIPVAQGDRAHNRLWRGLMERYHPLGSGTLCGAQYRYLVASADHGWLGALGFSAPAWRVGVRDRWIGWDDASRRVHLQEVVANTRFVLLPQVRVPHLASHVLGRCLRRLAWDWQARYGRRPVLVESYVDTSRHRGTCYRASNWRYVGNTQGRGRQDRDHRGGRSVKAVYVYPLCRDWRARLGGRAGLAPAPVQGDWADEEFGGVELGDGRLNRRLRTLARDVYAQPQAQLPQACGTRAKTKAAYRLLDHPRSRMQTLLNSHYAATAARVAQQPVVLVVQDSTGLNYTAHPATEALGPLNTRADGSIGLWMHDSLAVTPEGVPLGLVDVQLWARDPQAAGQRATRHERPIQEKESYKWLVGYQAAGRLARRCPDTTVVSVGDREADVYQLFVQAGRQDAGAKLLVRAERTRRMTAEHGSLWAYMAEQPMAGTQTLVVPRRGNQAARSAQMSVRFAPVTLRAPKRQPTGEPVSLWAVWTREEAPPPGRKALEWMLLTTVAVESVAQACECLAWYAKRWQIEVYHRTLKSGCRIEDRQLGHAERIEACLAVDMVVAWRIFYLAHLGRQTPDVPCTVYFESSQWQALVIRVTGNPKLPPHPPTLYEAMRMVASLGGFLGRKGDGEPGTQTLWRGLQRLDDLTDMYRLLRYSTGPPGVQQTCG
jgi:hypothetical protein